MKLEQLMEGVPFTLVQGSLDTEIADIIYDSRKAAPGLLFVCIVGTQRDSHAFAADCAAKGVSALVIQHDIDLSAMPGVTVVKVENSRYAMALMSANLFGNPARQMTMIGVTGTKGKTTTTHMIKSVLEAAGRKVGMIGTNGIYYMGRHKDTANTTPESYELQKTFREFLDAGCDTALMEVSSQGLMMDRVAGVHYDVGVFTNLSPDHIGPGEHKTFEEYRSWKGQLFKRCDVGVVNIDDENTAALLEGHTCKLVTYGRDEKADYRETGYELLRTHDFLGVAFHVTGKDEMDVKVNMPGEFSVYNALAALAVGKVLGLPDAAIHDGLGKCAITDAYALLKALNRNSSYMPEKTVVKMIANQVRGKKEADELFQKLGVVVNKFLDIDIDYLGAIPYDVNMQRAVMHQKPLSVADPDALASQSVEKIALSLLDMEKEKPRAVGIKQLFSNVIRMKFNRR